MTAKTKMIDRAGLVEIYDMLGQVKNNVDETMYRWRAASMRKQLEQHVEPITETREDAAKLQPAELEEERQQLCQRYAVKDKDGRPLISQGKYLIDPAQQSEFDDALVKLREKFKDKIDKFEAEVKKVNEFLKEKIEMPSITGTFKLSVFNKTTPQELLEVLFDYIEDDSAEKPAEPKKKAEKAKA